MAIREGQQVDTLPVQLYVADPTTGNPVRVSGGDLTIITGGLVPRGTYNAGTDYSVGDSVDYNGSSYVMFNDAPAGTLPTNTTYWQVLAEKGTTGADSTVPGPQGDPGNDGRVYEVHAGDNITVDNTDPANPIVSSTATGKTEYTLNVSYSLYPSWSYTTTYNVDDQINYYGTYYQSLQDENLNNTPTEGDFWTVIGTDVESTPGGSAYNPYFVGTNSEDELMLRSDNALGRTYIIFDSTIVTKHVKVWLGNIQGGSNGLFVGIRNANSYDSSELSNFNGEIGYSFSGSSGKYFEMDYYAEDPHFILDGLGLTGHSISNVRLVGGHDELEGYYELYTNSSAEYNALTQGQNADLYHSHALEYHNHQAGIEGYPTITEGTSGNAGKVSVATGEVWFFTDAERDVMELHTIATSGWLAPADETTSYVCADRDTNTWTLITDISNIDYLRYVPYFIVFKRSGSSNLHHQVISLPAHGEVENNHERVLRCSKYDREPGALENISVDASLNITASGGGVWATNYRYEILPITTATRQFKCYQTNGTWTVTSNTSPVVNNTQWNDTAVGYDDLDDGYWNITYLYRGIEDQDHCYTVIGTSQYATSELAQADNHLPEVPTLISSHTMFIGRIITQKNATSDYIIESAFTTVFAASSAVSAHNSLSGIQGGVSGQYYHLTSAQNTVVGNTSGTNSGDVTLNSPNHGLGLAGQTLTLGTPSTCTNETSNAVTTTTHTHAISGFATGTGSASGTNTGDQDLSGLMVKANNLSDVSNAQTARNNILPSKTGNANKHLRVNAGETDYELVTLAGGGDLVSTNNLSDVSSAPTALSNLIGSFTGNGTKVVRVNSGETDLEYATLASGGGDGGFAFKYAFDTSTSGTPSTGTIQYNNSTPASATLMYIYETDANSVAIDSYLDMFTSRDWLMLANADKSKYHVYKVQGPYSSGSNIDTVPVTYQFGTGTFTNAETVYFCFGQGGFETRLGLSIQMSRTNYTM